MLIALHKNARTTPAIRAELRKPLMTKADGLALKDEIKTALDERRAARASGKVLKALHAQTVEAGGRRRAGQRSHARPVEVPALRQESPHKNSSRRPETLLQ